MSPHEAIERVLKVLTPDLLAPVWRQRWTPANPTLGYCAVAAEAVYFLLGGPHAGLTSWVARDENGETHWWLKGSSGNIDPTIEQYTLIGRQPPYEKGKPCGFMGQRIEIGNPYGFDRRPSKRAQEVLRRIENVL